MIHPKNSSYISDPYETFSKLRQESPVFFAEELGLWVISRYDDVQHVLKDSATFSNVLTFAPIFPVSEHAIGVMSQVPLCPVAATSDPPEHTRLRKAMNHVFPRTPEQTKNYEPLIQSLVNGLLEKNFENGEVDIVKDFSRELSILVMLSILDVPRKDFDKIKRWLDGSVELTWGQVSEAAQVKYSQSFAEFINYCYDLTHQKTKQQSGDGLITRLIQYRNGNDQILTIKEIANTVFAFLAAGHETTANLISNGIYQLLRTQKWSYISQEPHKIPQAIEEVLRFDSPIVGWLRNTIQEATFENIVIPAHQRVLVLIASANRDKDQFADAEEFRIERNDVSDHVAFSVGRHYCIGANFARLEAEIALKTLVANFPNMQLKENFTPDYQPNMATRSLEKLPVII